MRSYSLKGCFNGGWKAGLKVHRDANLDVYALSHVSWGPEGHYQYSKMLCWEPEGCYRCTKSMVIAPFWFSKEHLCIYSDSTLLALNWLYKNKVILIIFISKSRYTNISRYGLEAIHTTPNLSFPNVEPYMTERLQLSSRISVRKQTSIGFVGFWIISSGHWGSKWLVSKQRRDRQC